MNFDFTSQHKSPSAVAFVLPIIMLDIPTLAQKQSIAEAFVKDLESFTVLDEETGTFHPVICCVCDGIPSRPDWSAWIQVSYLAKLSKLCGLARNLLKDIYPQELLDQYTAKHNALKDFVLSPKTLFNGQEEALVCRDCLRELEVNSAKHQKSRHPPKQSICNGYIIGFAPDVLTCLSEVEIAIISEGRIHCQSWIFFGGCHQQIKGWHTIFKNRKASNIANLNLLANSGMRGSILVVLCGPFTSTQKALTLKAVQVDPNKIVAAHVWMKANNFHCKDDVIPHIDELPVPEIVHEPQ